MRVFFGCRNLVAHYTNFGICQHSGCWHHSHYAHSGIYDCMEKATRATWSTRKVSSNSKHQPDAWWICRERPEISLFNWRYELLCMFCDTPLVIVCGWYVIKCSRLWADAVVRSNCFGRHGWNGTVSADRLCTSFYIRLHMAQHSVENPQQRDTFYACRMNVWFGWLHTVGVEF